MNCLNIQTSLNIHNIQTSHNIQLSENSDSQNIQLSENSEIQNIQNCLYSTNNDKIRQTYTFISKRGELTYTTVFPSAGGVWADSFYGLRRCGRALFCVI